MADQLATKAAAADLKQLQDATSSALKSKADATAVDQKLVDFKRSLSQLDERIAGFQKDFTVQLENNTASLAAITADLGQVQANFGDLLANLGDRLNSVETITTRVSTDFTQFQGTFRVLNRDFLTLRKRIDDSGLLRPP